MADIFISYSQKDRAIVAPLAEFLEDHGFDVWWDTALLVGDAFRSEIIRQLVAAQQVIVVWTAHSIDSDWVLGEASTAKHSDKLMPLRVADLAATRIPLGFTELHTEIESNRGALLRALSAKGITPSKGAAAQNAASVATSSTARRRFMWWSTHQSIAAEVPSVWAIAETILAVIAYWWVAHAFETYAHLVAGILVAPLVLLRSDQSIKLGLDCFDRWERGFYQTSTGWRAISISEKYYILGFCALAAAASFSVTYLLVSLWRPWFAGSYTVLIGAVIGWLGLAAGGIGAGAGAGIGAIMTGAPGGALPVVLTVAAAAVSCIAASVAASFYEPQLIIAVSVATVTAGLVAASIARSGEGKGPIAGARAGATAVSRGNAFIAGLILVPTVAAGGAAIFVLSIVVRVWATLCHLRAGLAALPTNFRRLALSTSPLQSPEIVPGLASQKSQFQLDIYLNEMISGDWASRIGLVLLLPVYIPAWFYRFSIKSTAWFWWPLAYVGSEPHDARDPEHMRRLVLGSPFRRLGRWVAALFLFAFAVVYVWENLVSTAMANGVRLPALPESSLIIGLMLNHSTTIPWQFAGLASAVIALFVGMWTSHAAISLQRANELKDLKALVRAGRPFPWIERLQRLGLLCTVLFWVALAGHLVLSANSQRCWIELPSSVSNWTETIYGDLAPPSPRCGPSVPARFRLF